MQIESKIKPLAQEKERSSTHSFTDVRACSFSHVGMTNLDPSLFEMHTFDTKKTEREEMERAVINDLCDGSLFGTAKEAARLLTMFFEWLNRKINSATVNKTSVLRPPWT